MHNATKAMQRAGLRFFSVNLINFILLLERALERCAAHSCNAVVLRFG